MASSYYGLVVRTTHVTGIITDLGFLLGAGLTGRRIASWKVALLTLLVCGYFLGGTVAAVAMPVSPRLVLFGCSLWAVAIAVGCVFLKQDLEPASLPPAAPRAAS